VLDNLIELRKKFNPDTVFLPSEHDLHQDHQVLNVEGLRAYKDLTVLGYELPWNHITYRAQAFVPLTEEHLQLKWRALQEYKSQIALKRPYFEWGFIEGLARVRGMQIKALYAESFEVVRINFGSL
jgi:LmbE family N-acetylglucosaminyl deacetylase